MSRTVFSAFLCMAMMCAACAEAASLKPLALEKSEAVPEGSCVTDYDPVKETVRIKSGNTVTNIPFSVFGAETQQKITAWAADKAFLSAYLCVSFEKEEKDADIYKWLDGVTYRAGKGSRITYTITVENRSPMAIHKIEAEYQIFYISEIERFSIDKSYRPISLKKSFYKTISFDLLPGEKKTFSTAPAYNLEAMQINYDGTIEEMISNRTVYGIGSQYKIQEVIKGVTLCLRKPGYDKNEVVRIKSDGSVPKEKEWLDWPAGEITQPVEAVQALYNTNASRDLSVMKATLSDRSYSLTGDAGALEPAVAFSFYKRYREMNNRQKQLYWADKVRELVEKYPRKTGRLKPTEMLEQLERMEAGADYIWGDYVSRNDESDPPENRSKKKKAPSL
jgi:hypothetical protein